MSAKRTTEMLRRVRQAGWTVEHGGKHWIVRPPGDGGQVVVSATPSDRRSTRNERARLRRAGLDI